MFSFVHHEQGSQTVLSIKKSSFWEQEREVVIFESSLLAVVTHSSGASAANTLLGRYFRKDFVSTCLDRAFSGATPQIIKPCLPTQPAHMYKLHMHAHRTKREEGKQAGIHITHTMEISISISLATP